MTRSDLNTVFVRAAATLLAAVVAAPIAGAAYFSWLWVSPTLASWEVSTFPVLEQRRHEEVDYPAFEQTAASCDGTDAIVSGQMSKVRSAEYVAPTTFAVWAMPGDVAKTADDLRDQLLTSDRRGHEVFLGKPEARFQRAFVVFSDQPPSSDLDRPVGVQDWGPWRIVNGCEGRWQRWFTVIVHRPWHGLYDLQTLAGPFELPVGE